ncbi:hypothetical protein JCM10207_004405 [Rhodosporidiobolus poonsookiae]
MASSQQDIYWTPESGIRPHAEEKPFAFIEDVNLRRGLNLKDYWDLHRWSVEKRADFWGDCWDYLGVLGHKGSAPAIDDSVPITDPQPWFPDAKLNFAANLLLSHKSARSSTKLAVVAASEHPERGNPPVERNRLTYAELYERVNEAATALRNRGVCPGDVVATFAVPSVEMVVVFLATTAIGAIFTSTPAEFGVRGCVDRYLQVKPKVLVAVDGYRYNGKLHNALGKVREVAAALKSAGLSSVVLISNLGAAARHPSAPAAVQEQSWDSFLEEGRKAAPSEIDFFMASFSHPAWIVYSSGTTGAPKAIVAPAGGLLLARKTTNRFQMNLDERDTMLQFANTGWIVYSLSLNFLASGGTLVCYDGSPFAPTGALWHLVEQYRCTKLGTSPRYLQTLNKAGYFVNQHHDVSSLKVLHVTGAPVTPDVYDYVEKHIGRVFLSNNCGGTEIGGGILHSVPTLPIYKAYLQVPVLGMDVAAYSPDGKPVFGSEGTMVIRKSFPNMPVGFVNDENRERYLAAYFNDKAWRPAVWNMQDSILIDPKTRGTIVLGRTDGILNPNGVRFGSAELYNILEARFAADVEDSIAVPLKVQGNEEVVLFLRTCGAVRLDSKLQARLRKEIAAALSVRHVPHLIEACPAVPVTLNGKKLETAVQKLINGTPLSKISTAGAQNPEVFSFYADWARKHRPRL